MDSAQIDKGASKIAKATKAKQPQQPQDEIMRHTVAAKPSWLDSPHPPAPDAHPVQVPNPLTADDMAFSGKRQG